MRKKTKTLEEQISELKMQLKNLENQQKKEPVKNCAVCPFASKCCAGCIDGLFCPKIDKKKEGKWMHFTAERDAAFSCAHLN